MRIKKINLRNIRSYKNQEIDFPEGSVLLSGDIGSGKTSILLAIEYALFGLQPGQKGSSLLSNDATTGFVKLELTISGKKVIIERNLKRSSKTVSQDSASITIDGEKIESSVTEIKTKIIELLNYPLEFIRKNNLLYRYTVYTPQEQMKQIIQEDPESRLNVLRHVFGIDKYKRIKENLQRVTGKLREESRILQAELNNLEENKNKFSSYKEFTKVLSNNLSSKKSQFLKNTEERKAIEKEIDSLQGKIKERENFKKEIEKTQILLSSKMERLSNEKNEHSELKNKIKKEVPNIGEKELEKIQEEIPKQKTLIKNLNSYLIEVTGKINSLKKIKKEDLEKKNRIFKIDMCPTCLQDVSDLHKHNILNETEKQLKSNEKEEKILSQEINKTLKNLEETDEELINLRNQISNFEIIKVRSEEINIAKEKLVSIEKNQKDLNKDIQFLESHIETLKQSTLEFTKFDNLFELKKAELRKTIQLEKNSEIEIAEIKKEIEITNKEIQQLENKIQEGEKTKEKMIHILDIESWLSSNFQDLVTFTEKNILSALRAEFTKIFNNWFSMLTTDSFHVYLDETFSPIITQKDFELPYPSLSGGERTAVALAYRLALNQIINSLLSKINTQGLVILDEPTDGFSENQLDKVRDILQELNMGQLIIVSHEQKIEGFVDNIIRLKKENGTSIQEN
tara:strand:- start:2388 stop:4436 length:2049 start_codon:yes stop_codon:yes gene_type:complete